MTLLQLAELAGAQPLAAFGAGLLLVLAGTALAWRLLHRWMVPSQRSGLPPGGFLLSRLLLGFAVIVAAAWAFSEVAEALGAGPALAEADQSLADHIAARVPAVALRGFAAVTHLGDPLTLTVACVALGLLWLLRGHRGTALAWVVALAGNGVLNPTLKQVFERVRPVHDTTLAHAWGYSFPSGHSSGSVVAWGMLAYLLLRWVPARWQLPMVLAAAAAAFTVGCSRVFLRVHFASDVAAGFASGLAWLAVCIVSVELTRHYRRRRASASGGPA